MARYKFKLLILLGLIGQTGAAADAFPPLGSRLYWIDPEKAEKPSDISLKNGETPREGKVYMRDPLTQGSAQGAHAKRPSSASSQTISKMVFEKAPVQGRYLVPRVPFDRPKLKIGEAEAPQPYPYRTRILESERVLKEFDW